MQLDPFLVGEVPRVYYVPDYLSDLEERRIVEEVGASKAKWVEVGRSPGSDLSCWWCCMPHTHIC
jgi:hypothetical protein